MIRALGPADHPALAALLLADVERAMFPLANLRAHGLAAGGFASLHPHATRFWAVGAGVVGLTRGGMLMPLLPEPQDVSGLRAALAGVALAGAVGPTPAVRRLLADLALAERPMRLNEDEPGFRLDLADLRLPERLGAELIRPGAAHRAGMLDWRRAYHLEVLGTPAAEAGLRSAADVDDYLAKASHRLLLQDGVPVAMTGFNAALPEIVQIGGVYTPPARRGLGHARLAVALHLAEARAAGVSRAVLFAANPAAERAYRAIGFAAAEPVTLALFDRPQAVAA